MHRTTIACCVEGRAFAKSSLYDHFPHPKSAPSRRSPLLGKEHSPTTEGGTLRVENPFPPWGGKGQGMGGTDFAKTLPTFRSCQAFSRTLIWNF